MYIVVNTCSNGRSLGYTDCINILCNSMDPRSLFQLNVSDGNVIIHNSHVIKTNNSKEEFKMKEKKKIDLGDAVITIGWIAASLAVTIVTQNIVDRGGRAVATAYHNYKDNSDK